MKLSTFFAIFLPIFAAMLSIFFIIFFANKKPNPKLVRLAYVIAAVGIILFIIILIITYW